jgi:4-alpha-glucanotransferase
LPGRFGIGDLGPVAVSFLDWAQTAGLSLWQVLPLGPPAFGDSPYGVASSFAGNPFLISPERLVESGLLPAAALDAAPAFPADRVEFAAVGRWKAELLRASFEQARGQGAVLERLAAFRAAEQEWLADWALYSALKRKFERRPWVEWPLGLRQRQPAALDAARRELREDVEFAEYLQFVFDEQWRSLRAAAGDRGIGLIGDLPIYVADDGADVWTHQELFVLDAAGRPRAVAGVPPDAFSDEGQRWGSPLYDWNEHERTDFRWWRDRLRATLRRVDLVRIDHFRGLAAYWEIPAEEPTALVGRWRRGPGAKLLRALARGLDAGEGLPLIAEDLGVITADVAALRERFDLPGMRVLLFAWGEADSPHAPHNHTRRSVVYTGTHDNDTVEGWWASAPASEKSRAVDVLGHGPETISWKMIRAAYGSVADDAVVPMQDFLGLGSAARFNTPAQPQGNWAWRLVPEQVPEDLAAKLRRLAEVMERLPRPPAAPGGP